MIVVAEDFLSHREPWAGDRCCARHSELCSLATFRSVHDRPVGLGWRVHSSSAVVVAVSGPASSPVIVHRGQVTLVDDASLQEPYHAAAALSLDDAPALIASVAEVATVAAEATLRGFVSSLGAIAAVGLVGGDRRLPELSRILAKHALLHAAERDLYEQAVIHGATRAGLPVTTIPATGRLLDDASVRLGVTLGAALTAVGRSIGPPWKKDHREAAAAALVALHAQA